jgi:hypothetical protein
MALSEITRNTPNANATLLTETGVSVAVSGNTVVISILLNGLADRVAIGITNAGPTNALDQCVIEAQDGEGGTWFTYVSNAELNTGTALAGRLDLVVTNPTTLAADGHSFIVLDVRGLYAVRLVASAATGAVTVSAKASVRYG